MRIERSRFDRPSHGLFEVARCRVIVEPADFQRLQLREFECAAHLSPCLAWCHQSIGQGYVSWELDASGPADVFYFTQLSDGEAFYDQFGPAQAGLEEQRLAA